MPVRARRKHVDSRGRFVPRNRYRFHRDAATDVPTLFINLRRKIFSISGVKIFLSRPIASRFLMTRGKTFPGSETTKLASGGRMTQVASLVGSKLGRRGRTTGLVSPSVALVFPGTKNRPQNFGGLFPRRGDEIIAFETGVEGRVPRRPNRN